MTAPDWDNPSVRTGMRAMLDQRASLIASGERMIGWKLGFGAPAWLEKFGLGGPLLGFLPEARRHTSGDEISCVGWVNPVFEPEIALHIGHDIDDPTRAAQAISALGSAIELADVDHAAEDLEDVLSGNIFHRAVILGEPMEMRHQSLTEGLRAVVTRDGEVVVDTTDLQGLTGDLADILGHAAGLLDAAGDGIRSGEVVIMGSVVPPLAVRPGNEISFRLEPLRPISVRV